MFQLSWLVTGSMWVAGIGETDQGWTKTVCSIEEISHRKEHI